jgi:hypothetical protein
MNVFTHGEYPSDTCDRDCAGLVLGRGDRAGLVLRGSPITMTDACGGISRIPVRSRLVYYDNLIYLYLTVQSW